jgi:ABC-2 type transport system permease protein
LFVALACGMITSMSIAVDTRSLTKRFSTDSGWRSVLSRRLDRPAVDCVNLKVEQGELFGLVGPNGAGKTTLVKMLTTLVTPTAGTAFVNGFGLECEMEIKRSVGLVTSDERSFYWRLTGQQNLEFFAALNGLNAKEAKIRSAQVIEQVGLQEHLLKPFQKYSAGMKQRLSIARALLVHPTILFLDEPTKGLDPEATRNLHFMIQNQLVGNEGITVFLTSHNLDEVQRLCDRIAIMSHGRVQACGNLSELRAHINSGDRFHLQVRGWNPKLQQSLYEDGIRLHIEESSEKWVSFSPIAPLDLKALNRMMDTIRQKGGQIESLTRQQVSLDDVYTHLIGDNPQPDFSCDNAKSSVAQIVRLSRQGLFEDLLPGSLKQFLRVAVAALRRDIQSEISYRFSFFLQFVNIFFSVAVFYFVAQLLGEGINPYLEPYGGDYFSFVLIGIAFGSYFSVGLSSFSNSLRSAQMTGTLEAMLSTPTRISTIILSSSQWNYILTTLRVVVYLLIGALFLDVHLGNANYLAVLAILVLTVISFSSLGIIAAGFIMVLKRGDPVTWIFGTISSLLGGVYYPVTVMPEWMQILANWIPITYALRAMRLALLQGASFIELRTDIFALGIFCLVLLPLSLIIFAFAVRVARSDGSLTHY